MNLIPEDLRYKILSKKVILFLGAGATVESGGTLGCDLAKYIYDEIGETGVLLNNNLARYTQALVSKGYRQDIEKIVRKKFGSLKPSEQFANIANIPWKAIYTTNYDDLIEKSYDLQKYYECVVENLERPQYTYSHNQIPLFKINGDINQRFDENNLLIITLEDLKKNNMRNEQMMYRLIEDLNDTFIFVGYSFGDSLITNILDDLMKTKRWESIKEKYVVLPEISEDTKMDLDIYGMKYIESKSEDFITELNNLSRKSYLEKLNSFKSSLPSLLKSFEPRTLSKISGCFDVYNKDEEYPVDSKFFYRGGNPSWGIIRDNFDISRNFKLDNHIKNVKMSIESSELSDIIFDICNDNKLRKILLGGPAVSGKSTALLRLSYDLMEKGCLTLVLKSQTNYQQGLLHDIYKQISSSFVVVIDNLIVDSNELNKMLSEASTNNIPVIFIISVRYSEWENILNEYSRSRLSPLDMSIEISDNISSLEGERLVTKLIESGLIKVSNKYEKDSIIKKFISSNNLIEILLEIVDRTSVSNSVCSDYDILSEEAKMSYGLISLTYRYDLKLKWELLRRAIEKKYTFTWDDFVQKILNADAKGNMFTEETQGFYYISGRHRFISKLIIDIHYKGNFSEEIQDIKNLIISSSGNEYEERFIGKFLYSMLSDSSRYLDAQIADILDCAIDSFVYEHNKAFITHLKGEFYISCREYGKAIICFDANVQNDMNLPHSLHSLGKSYLYLAQTYDVNSGVFRNNINISKEKLFIGLNKFSDNEFFYSTFISLFDYLHKYNVYSEADKKDKEKFTHKALSNIGVKRLEELQNNFINTNYSKSNL